MIDKILRIMILSMVLALLLALLLTFVVTIYEKRNSKSSTAVPDTNSLLTVPEEGALEYSNNTLYYTRNGKRDVFKCIDYTGQDTICINNCLYIKLK